MVWFRKHLRVVSFGLLLFLTVTVLLAGRVVDKKLLTRKTERPKDVKGSAFGKLTRIGGTAWEIGTLYLSFRNIQVEDGSVYLMGEYPDADGIKRGVLVFIGKIEGDGSARLLSRFLGKNMEEVLSRSIKYEDLASYLKEGDRIQVDFLINVPDYDKVVNETTFCKDLPDICAMGKITQQFQASYGGFWYKHEPLPPGMSLNAITVFGLL